MGISFHPYVQLEVRSVFLVGYLVAAAVAEAEAEEEVGPAVGGQKRAKAAAAVGEEVKASSGEAELLLGLAEQLSVMKLQQLALLELWTKGYQNINFFLSRVSIQLSIQWQLSQVRGSQSRTLIGDRRACGST